MKKNLIILVTIICISIFMVCGIASAEEDAKIKIGVSLPSLMSAFHLYEMAGVRDYADTEMPDGYEVVILNAEFKPDMQLSQVESMIADGASAIVLNGLDEIASAACVDACVEAGIPIITVNTTVTNQDLVNAHVGADDYIAGKLQMEAAIELIGGKGNVAVLHGMLGHSGQVARWKAYQDVVAEYPNVKIIAEGETQFATDIAQNVTENWIQAGLDIDVIVCNNDSIAIGAVNAIESSGEHGNIQVVGLDAMGDTLGMVKDGTLAVTFDQDAMRQGAMGVKLAIDAIEGRPVEDYYIDCVRVDSSTIDDYLELSEERDEILARYMQ